MLKPDYQLKPLESRVENVGKLIHGSKRRYAWKFQAPDGPHELCLTLSIVSSKFKLLYDGSELDRGEMPFFQAFEHRAAVGDFRFLIEQQKTSMKLYVNEQLFELGCNIDVFLNRNPRLKSSRSVAKLVPKESQLDRPVERRQTEYLLPPRGPGAQGTVNVALARAQARQEELEKIKFNKGLLVSQEKSGVIRPVSGSAPPKFQWTPLDPYEAAPDHFFAMSLNHDAKMVESIINRLYC